MSPDPVVLGEGGPNDQNAIALETRRKNRIPNCRRPERDPESLRAGVQAALNAFPGIKPVSATAVYNCVGLVFGARRTWIDTSEVSAILQDDGFRLVSRKMDWKPGDVVVYKADDGEILHVGVIHTVDPKIGVGDFDVTVISAWGITGEFAHGIEQVHTLLGRPTEVWSQHKSWR